MNNECIFCKRMDHDAKKMNIYIEFNCKCHEIKKIKERVADSSVETKIEK